MTTSARHRARNSLAENNWQKKMADRAYGSKFWLLASGAIAVEVIKVLDFITDVYVLIEFGGKAGEDLPAVFPASHA